MRVREELNKLKFHVHAAGGKRFKFEDKPSFFSLSGCSTTVHLLDHQHFHVLDVVVIGQIKMLGHGKTSSMIAGIMIVSLHRPKVLTKTVCKFTASFPKLILYGEGNIQKAPLTPCEGCSAVITIVKIVIVRKKLMSVFNASVLLLTMNFVMTLSK